MLTTHLESAKCFRVEVTAAFVSALSFLTPITVKAEINSVPEIVEVARELDRMCRGSPGETLNLDRICNLRDKAFSAANSIGYCYGKKGQYGYQMQWHRCTKDSVR